MVICGIGQEVTSRCKKMREKTPLTATLSNLVKQYTLSLNQHDQISVFEGEKAGGKAHTYMMQLTLNRNPHT